MIDPITGLPNTEAATSSSTSIVPDNQILGKDDFLKLLVTQMRTQDPLAPMDGQQMAAQLAQFSSVEQLMVINEGIEAQTAASNQMIGMLSSTLGSGLVGKEVLAFGDRFNVPTDTTARFQLEGPATATVSLVDSVTGRQVATMPLGSLPAGVHELDASALTTGVPPGNYHIQIAATDSSGLNQVLAHPLIRFVVDGMRFGPNGAVVTGPGGIESPLTGIIEMNLPPDPTQSGAGTGANPGSGSSGS